MTPIFAANNPRDRAWRAVEHFGKLSVSSVGCATNTPHFDNLGISQNSVSVGLTLLMHVSSFKYHVVAVDQRCAKEKMIWPDAPRSVAPVENVESFRNKFPAGHNPGCAVGGNRLRWNRPAIRTDASVTVSVCSGSPNPTWAKFRSVRWMRSALVDLGPKPGMEFFVKPKVHQPIRCEQTKRPHLVSSAHSADWNTTSEGISRKGLFGVTLDAFTDPKPSTAHDLRQSDYADRPEGLVGDVVNILRNVRFWARVVLHKSVVLICAKPSARKARGHLHLYPRSGASIKSNLPAAHGQRGSIG